MIKIEHRTGYDAIVCLSETGKQQGKIYVKPNGLISNFYIRKKYRGNSAIFKAIAETLISRYGMLPLYAYASPSEDKSRRNALLRLYSRYGFKNVSTNKVVYNP